MKISKELVKDILHNIRKYPPEMGGILGQKNGVICEYMLDEGCISSTACSYIPETDKLNKRIAEWELSNISFVGIFHTHFSGVKTLSCGDKKYIEKIMLQMPYNIEELYFPIIVFPQSEIVYYLATKSQNKILIKETSILEQVKEV